jgi:hypothetical protein
MSEISVYNKFAPRLVELGYLPLALGPKIKIPQSWIPSEQRFVNTEGWNHPNFQPRTTPQPGAGIGVRCGRQADGSYLVGLDADSEPTALATIDAFPDLAVTKYGKRGFTGFFHSLAPVASRAFRDAKGNMLLQVLGDGTQSVLPPTIHPDTQKEYVWTCDGTLYDIPFANLPQWPADAFERIEGIVRPLGWEPEPERPARANGGGTDSDSPFRQVNDWALQNLHAWVPDLGLQDCKRQRGRHCSYRAVASYREGAERADSLSFTSKGIKDFGTDESFTPINIVMRVLGLSAGDAYEWLKTRVAPERPEIRIDFEALAGKSNTKQTTDARSDNDASAQSRKSRFKLEAFDDIQISTEPSYLVDEFVPIRGIVMVWGKKKSLKSFSLLSMLLHVAKSWRLHGRSVQQGHGVYCAFEGGHGYAARVEALRQEYNLDQEAERTPLHLIRGGANLIYEHGVLVSAIRERSVRPAVVVLDTLNKSLHGSENKDVDMAAYIRAAESIRDAFDCVIIVHHCGWDESRARGHSSLGGAVDAEISAAREGDIVTLTVEEMRDGPDGGQVFGRAKVVSVGTDRMGKEMTSVVIVPVEEEDCPASIPRGGRLWPKTLGVFHSALVEALLTHGFDFKIENCPTVRAVDLEKARDVFCRIYVVASDGGVTKEQQQDSRRRAFSRALEKAQALKLIAARALENGRPRLRYNDTSETKTDKTFP